MSEIDWNCWTDYVGKRVMVYTPTLHIVGTLETYRVDQLGVAWGLFRDVEQVGDDKETTEFAGPLKSPELFPIPSTSVVMGPRVLA